ncbi:hypothetical protein pb186bvf_002930 [Paramecium bursaria]
MILPIKRLQSKNNCGLQDYLNSSLIDQQGFSNILNEKNILNISMTT